MQDLFEENKYKEDWGILLVNAANGFNALNPKAMLWPCCGTYNTYGLEGPDLRSTVTSTGHS